MGFKLDRNGEVTFDWSGTGRYALIGLFLIFVFGSFVIIPTGYVGMKSTFGKFDMQELPDGLQLKIPLVQNIELASYKVREIKETIQVPTNEGLVVGLDVSVIYSLDRSKLSELRVTVAGDPEQTLVIPYLRNVVRDEIAGRTVKDVYSIQRETISENIEVALQEQLSERGILVENVLLRDVNLPQKVVEAIQLKLQKEQEALQKEWELKSAKMDAEIRVVDAEGIAEAQQIISESLTEKYLQYEFIKALSDKDNNIIYVPTEANLPILEAGKR